MQEYIKEYKMSVVKFFHRLNSFFINRYNRLYVYPKARNKFSEISILNPIESIQYIIDNRCSLSRYGDGEFGVMHGWNIGFQKTSEELAKRLSEVLVTRNIPNFKVAIPYTFKKANGLLPFACDFWGKYVNDTADLWLKYLSRDEVYLDTELSRFYKDWKDYDRSTKHIRKLKQLWGGQKLVIVEGCQSRTGIGNDLYANAKSIERILGYATDAFFHYNEMLNTIKKYIKPEDEKLILLSYGPTATVLAYDLAKLGYWAIDLGHLDVEYEWYLRKDRWGKIESKYVNELAGGNIVEGCDDEEYHSQIICDITKGLNQ